MFQNLCRRAFKSTQLQIIQYIQHKPIFPKNIIQRSFTTIPPKAFPFGKHNKVSPLVKTLYLRLQKLHNEHQVLNDVFLNNTEMDPAKLETARVRLHEISQHNAIYEQIHNLLTSLEELKKMKKETSEEDLETHSLLDEEIESCDGMIEEVQDKAVVLLIPPEKYDDCNSINIEIRPAVGGSEASLFAEDILHMLQSYINIKGWNGKIANYQADGQIGKGCKYGQVKVTGHEVYKYLKCESGVHKVIRVPETEKMGRLQSSAISVVVLPEIPLNFQLNDKDIRIDFMRASGAGGQHVNKTESACRVTHIPTGITAFNQDDRTQHTNKAKALATLKERLFSMEVTKAQDNLHSQRKEQISTGDRSDKIRTYNFPQSRITDHRTGLTLYGIDKMLKGELLEEFIEGYLKKVYDARITDLLADKEDEGE